MTAFLTILNGSKTYIVCGVTVAYAAVQWYLGGLDPNAAAAMVLGASGLGALRHGVSTTMLAVLGQMLPTILASVKPTKEVVVPIDQVATAVIAAGSVFGSTQSPAIDVIGTQK